jgi:hypothetical protein
MPDQPEELFSIVFTEDDVIAMAEAAGVPAELALDRAHSWAKYVGEAATQRCNEQLASIAQHDTP